MPVLATQTLASPPTNCFGLIQYLQQRLPGYDPSEYLRELNSAYVHVWEEISKLKNHYFTAIKTVTVAAQGTDFDLMFNSNAGLSAAISPRLYQISKMRIQPPSGGLFQATTMYSPTHPDYVSLAANPNAQPTTTGPYYWYLFGRNNVRFALPLAVGTVIEVTYVFWLVQMTYLFNGTISNAGTTVTGVNSNFKSLCQPDFQANLPTTLHNQDEIQAEIVVSQPSSGQQAINQIYQVASITADTTLTTTNAIAPAQVAGSLYILATLPEIPREHIRVIASIAMAKMFSVAGDDARVQEWTAYAQSNMQMMKDSLIERQSNNPATRQRFPFSAIRGRNRVFLR